MKRPAEGMKDHQGVKNEAIESFGEEAKDSEGRSEVKRRAARHKRRQATGEREKDRRDWHERAEKRERPGINGEGGKRDRKEARETEEEKQEAKRGRRRGGRGEVRWAPWYEKPCGPRLPSRLGLRPSSCINKLEGL